MRRITLLLALALAVAACGGEETATEPGAAEQPAAVEQPAEGVVEQPAEVEEPTDAPTDIPEPTEVPPTATTEPEPISLSGSGQTATEAVVVPWSIALAHFTHSGSRNFIVKGYQGDSEDLYVNTIGVYDGTRPLIGGGEVFFDIDADGAWTVTIEGIGQSGEPSFSGTGDAVSGVFDPPAGGPWQFSHDGERNFIVKLHCAGGSDLVENDIGAVSGSTVVKFDDGPCFWEVEADGSWSLSPR